MSVGSMRLKGGCWTHCWHISTYMGERDALAGTDGADAAVKAERGVFREVGGETEPWRSCTNNGFGAKS